MSVFVDQFMALVKAKNQAQPEFIQAVEEVVESLEIVLDKHPEYRSAKILERIVEPERVLMFRIPWMTDQGDVQVNRGFRIQEEHSHEVDTSNFSGQVGAESPVGRTYLTAADLREIDQ